MAHLAYIYIYIYIHHHFSILCKYVYAKNIIYVKTYMYHHAYHHVQQIQKVCLDSLVWFIIMPHCNHKFPLVRLFVSGVATAFVVYHIPPNFPPKTLSTQPFLGHSSSSEPASKAPFSDHPHIWTGISTQHSSGDPPSPFVFCRNEFIACRPWRVGLGLHQPATNLQNQQPGQP